MFCTPSEYVALGGGYDVTYLTNSGHLCRSMLDELIWSSPVSRIPLTCFSSNRTKTRSGRVCLIPPPAFTSPRQATPPTEYRCGFPLPPLRNLTGRSGARVEGLRLYYLSLGAPAPYGGPGAPPPPPGGAARAGGGGIAAAGRIRAAVSLLSRLGCVDCVGEGLCQ